MSKEWTTPFDEVLVPTEEVLEMRGGQKRKSESVSSYPGYVLGTRWNLMMIPGTW